MGTIPGPPSSGAFRQQTVKDLADIFVHVLQVQVWQGGLRDTDNDVTACPSTKWFGRGQDYAPAYGNRLPEVHQGKLPAEVLTVLGQ